MIKLKRIYENPDKSDGYRVLVDRLWPRGVSKGKAALDLWLKDIAPSNELRIWFGHDPKKWPEFQKKYRAEIKANEEAFTQLREIVASKKTVTLLFSAKDENYNQAIVIKSLLQERR